MFFIRNDMIRIIDRPVDQMLHIPFCFVIQFYIYAITFYRIGNIEREQAFIVKTLYGILIIHISKIELVTCFKGVLRVTGEFMIAQFYQVDGSKRFAMITEQHIAGIIPVLSVTKAQVA